jgi:hypothetical protein
MSHTTLAAVLLLGVSSVAVPTHQQAELTGRTSARVTTIAPIFVQPGAMTPLRVAAVGTTLNVLKEDGEWAQVEFQDPQWGMRVGWVQTKLIQIWRPELQPIDLSIKDDSAAQRKRTNAPRRAEPVGDPTTSHAPQQDVVPSDAMRGRPQTRAAQDVAAPPEDAPYPFPMPAGVEKFIDAGLTLKGQGTGLVLTDAAQGVLNVLTALADGMNNCPGCSNTKSGFSVVAFTPLTWIEWQASQAAKEYRTFDLSMVTEEMAAPVLRIRVNPDIPSHVIASGLAGTSSVQHVVLRCAQKKTVIQPLNKSTFVVTVKNAMGGNAQYEGVEAIFPLDGVAQLRGPRGDQEFFVTVVGTGYEKNFKIKQKHFKQLPM